MKSFEKNIKNKAASFQLDPMPDSFDKVMEALEKKKKRRFIFWLWFIIPGFAIGGSSVFIFMGPLNSSKNTLYTATSIHTSYQQPITTNVDTNKASQNSTLQKTKTGSIQNQNKELIEKNETFDHTNVQDKKLVLNNTIPSITPNKEDHQTVVSTHQEQETTHKSKEIIVNNSTYDHTIDFKKREQEQPILYANNSVGYLPLTVSPLIFKRTNIPLSNAIRPVIKNHFSKWSIGLYGEVGAMKSIFNNNAPDDSIVSGYYYDARVATDRFLFSYAAGIQVRYSPVKFLAIESGIGFTHYESYQIITNAGISVSSIDSSQLDTVFTINSLGPTSKEYKNIYEYISIPLKVYYQKKWKWTGIEVGAGVIFDIPVNTHSYVVDENDGISYLKHEVKDSRLNPFGLQVSTNFHMVFHAKKFSFFAGPIFKYRINSMFDNKYMIKQHSYFIGAEMGIRYNF